MFYLLRPILFRTCYFSGLCSSNIPRYFLDFAYTSMAQPRFRLIKVISVNKIESLVSGDTAQLVEHLGDDLEIAVRARCAPQFFSSNNVCLLANVFKGGDSQSE